MFQSWISDAFSSLYLNNSQFQCPPLTATHDRNLSQNDTIALLMNLWRKSFCIVDKMSACCWANVLYIGNVHWYIFIPYLVCLKMTCIVYLQQLTSVESMQFSFLCSWLCEIVADQPLLSLWLAIYMYGCSSSTYYWLCIRCIVLHLHLLYLTGLLNSPKKFFFAANNAVADIFMLDFKNFNTVILILVIFII